LEEGKTVAYPNAHTYKSLEEGPRSLVLFDQSQSSAIWKGENERIYGPIFAEKLKDLKFEG
jgi:hypothetical protein